MKEDPLSTRQTYSSIDSALSTFPWWPKANLERIHELTSGLSITEVYTPPRRSYIGLVVEGATRIVSISSGFVAGVQDGRGNNWVALPVNALRDGDAAKGRDQPMDPCPICSIGLPKSGLCGNCF